VARPPIPPPTTITRSPAAGADLMRQGSRTAGTVDEDVGGTGGMQGDP
jgi:hypothetical protein